MSVELSRAGRRPPQPNLSSAFSRPVETGSSAGQARHGDQRRQNATPSLVVAGGLHVIAWSHGDPLVNAPARVASTPRLENYPLRLSDNVRFADLDVNGHVNNAVYASYFETGRVILVRNPELGLTPAGAAWVMVRLDTHFRAELHWPGTIETGLGVQRLGRTSVTFDQVVFSEGRCIASALATTVLVDAGTRKPTPLPASVIERFQPWMVRADDRA